MSRIENIFESLKKQGRKALVTFITAGDPDYETSISILKGLPEAGADIIELGMPFADPMADGPAIQAAGLRALKGGACMTRTLEMVREFRKDDTETPLVLMGYFNPVLAFGLQKFAGEARAAGVDGLIIVDLPPEEDAEFRALAKESGIDLIRLIAPTTDAARLPKVLEGAGGFLYYVSITGITGAASADLNAIRPHLANIRAQTGLPLAIGFGIKTPEDARKMAELGDAVVVGSAIVETIGQVQGGVIDPVLTQVRALAGALNPSTKT